MGLAEKQAWAAFKENSMPAKLSELQKTTGTNVEVAFDEPSFTIEAVQWVADSFFKRFLNDLEEICGDKLGKEAVSEAIKKIFIKHSATATTPELNLTGGTLTITAKWDGSAGSDYPGMGDYKTFLMSKL